MYEVPESRLTQPVEITVTPYDITSIVGKAMKHHHLEEYDLAIKTVIGKLLNNPNLIFMVANLEEPEEFYKHLYIQCPPDAGLN